MAPKMNAQDRLVIFNGHFANVMQGLLSSNRYDPNNQYKLVDDASALASKMLKEAERKYGEEFQDKDEQ